MRKLVTTYNELKDYLPLFLDLYRRIRKDGLGKQQIAELLKTPRQLLDLKKKVDLYMTTYGVAC